MPHITNSLKIALRSRYPTRAGELDYSLTEVVLKYLQVNGINYDSIADIRGALHGTLREFDRNIADVYEAQKAHDNGNVYQEVLDGRINEIA